ncbi:hypothetical protein [Lacrimispora saccharolytica]|uniref:hypothetical protein n=1 Tax=Lacrimispora saccharolytica TaxID=84030 RepID=UPI00195DC7A2|nr:hypothetical protein [Lacrimispora saccharolytica]QRV18683.1 hypothetical protein I6K70_14340 [Lacrimispora saccharolytica]
MAGRNESPYQRVKETEDGSRFAAASPVLYPSCYPVFPLPICRRPDCASAPALLLAI